MDFKSFAEKAKKVASDAADKVKDFTDKTVEKTAQSFAKSKVFIRDDENSTKKEKLDKLIQENKKIIIIFGKEESEFFRKALVMFPVLFTKGWAQNFKLKLYPLDADESVNTDYGLEKLPSLIIFKEGEMSEKIEGEENVMTVVKKLSLDIEGVVK